MATASRTIQSRSREAETIRRVVVGTAGHIDHGKSSLVLRLTGIDPDRLPEEKARGLTIDLGFANLALSDGSRLGIVDVPGHEKFVHNMVAGATGIDIALLVVAADDGVMPQTLEHLEILELLGLTRGAIALTKIDLVDRDVRELAAEDVRTTVKGTFLEAAPIFPVSSVTGEGIEDLLRGLETLVAETPVKPLTGVFRMPIQRVFAAKGFGCVVTGIPVSGSLTIGDHVEIVPPSLTGTVRGLEAYHHTVGKIAAGHSSAVNLTGVDSTSCIRGMSVVTPGAVKPVRVFEASLRHLSRRKRPLKHRAALRLHVGTLETACVLSLLDRNELAPGETALVQILTEGPVVCGVGDRFLLRLPSPAETVGGGTVISTHDRRLRRNVKGTMDLLTRFAEAIGSPKQRAVLEVAHLHPEPVKLVALANVLGIGEAACETLARELVSEGKLAMLANGAVVEAVKLAELRDAAEAFIVSFFRSHAERLVCERTVLRENLRVDNAVLDHVLAELTRGGKFESEPGGGARIASPKSHLTPEQETLRSRVLTRIEAAGFQPPSNEELTAEFGVQRTALDMILKRLVDEKRLSRISAEYHFAEARIEQAREAVVRICTARAKPGQVGDLDLPTLRDELGTTRRWLIPLMEWFDGTGFTTRLGGRRIVKRRP